MFMIFTHTLWEVSLQLMTAIHFPKRSYTERQTNAQHVVLETMQVNTVGLLLILLCACNKLLQEDNPLEFAFFLLYDIFWSVHMMDDSLFHEATKENMWMTAFMPCSYCYNFKMTTRDILLGSFHVLGHRIMRFYGNIINACKANLLQSGGTVVTRYKLELSN